MRGAFFRTPVSAAIQAEQEGPAWPSMDEKVLSIGKHRRYVQLATGEIRPRRAAIYKLYENGDAATSMTARPYAFALGAQISHLFMDAFEPVPPCNLSCRRFPPVGHSSTLAHSGIRRLLIAAQDQEFDDLIIDEQGAKWTENKPITTNLFCRLHERGVEIHTVGRGKWSFRRAAQAALDDDATTG